MPVTELIPGSLHRVVRPGEHGTARVVCDSPDLMTRLRAARDGQPLRAEKYTRLIVGNTLWMTDAEYECWTNQKFVEAARGDVLIAGLGLGLILGPALAKPGVRSVTVIEREPDVVALIEPTYKCPKLSVVVADAREWTPPAKAFDCIYLDIWPSVPDADDRADILSLKMKYRRALRPTGWIGAWCEENTRRR